MSSTIQLREGDMFAQPADLIIIPCSTGASVTEMVASRLRSFDIVLPRRPMRLGDVEFLLFERASSIATYVGYAASVQGFESNVSAVQSIAAKVANFVNDKPEIRNITIPLLGSGAGRLTSEQSALALIRGLEGVSTNNKVFNIFVYEPAIFLQLKRALPKRTLARHKELNVAVEPIGVVDESSEKQREAVRVFVSYTGSEEHRSWVKLLARFLRENGVDARLDVWHLRPGMDLPQWMSNEIDLADRILIVCNEDYAARADGRLGGVGWEMRLVQGDLLQTQSLNPKKYLPIIRDEYTPTAVPMFLKGVFHLVVEDDLNVHNQQALLRELFNVYEEAPPLGTPPRYVLA